MIKILRSNAGFTLTEMAMVIMIMGVVGSILMTSLSARMSQTSHTVTKQRMAAIKEAMISFLRVKGRLPCPDTVVTAPTGQAADTCSSSTTGATSSGIVPWQTLGLPREGVLDGWGNFFTYHVTAKTSAGSSNWTAPGTLNDASIGDLIVLQRKSDGTGTEQVTEVVLVLVSHGPNGKGAGTVKGTQNAPPTDHPHELENTNLDGTYVQRDFSDNTDLVTNPNGPFDDIVEYMTVADLIGPLIGEGSVKSSAAQLEEIRNLLKGYILQSFSGSSCTFPGAWTALGNFDYTTAVVTVSMTAETDIITVDSTSTPLNPDIRMTKQQAIGLFTSAGKTLPACLDHGYGVIADLFATIKHTLVAYMVNHFSSDSCAFPETLGELGLPTADPWGGNLEYIPVTVNVADPESTTIFTVKSTVTPTVNHTLSMTKAEANGLLIAAGMTPAGCLMFHGP
ncbi:MAG: type II secretion system protein [Magnetococcales bacterium]|nr:type II secretion system protein [Magnetococcales bacterium]